MTAQMQIDQVGLPAGTPGRARTDGLNTGALVTLTSLGGGAKHKFVLLWVPASDTTAEASLAVTGSPNIFDFTPTAAAPGTYLIELIENEGLATETRQQRVFRVRTATRGLVIPALNEVADPTASLVNKGAAIVAASDDNALDWEAPLTTFDYAGWWRWLHELTIAVDGGGGGGVDDGLFSIENPLLRVAPGAATNFLDGSGGNNFQSMLYVPDWERWLKFGFETTVNDDLHSVRFTESDPANVFAGAQWDDNLLVIADALGPILSVAIPITSPETTHRVVVGYGRDIAGTGHISTSDNAGFTWAARNITASITGGPTAMVFSGLNVVIATASGEVETSPDGITWTDRIDPFVGGYKLGVSDGEGVVLLFQAGSNTAFARSTDHGETWLSSLLPSAMNVIGATFLNGVIYVQESSPAPGRITQSNDLGISWTTPATPTFTGPSTGADLRVPPDLTPNGWSTLITIGNFLLSAWFDNTDGVWEDLFFSRDGLSWTPAGSQMRLGTGGSDTKGLFPGRRQFSIMSESTDTAEWMSARYDEGGGSGGGQANDGVNVGVGADVFRDKTVVTLNFRRLRGINDITTVVNGNSVDIDGAALLPLSGARAMTGDLDMGAQAIVNVGLVDGVDVSAHATRHANAGADELNVTGLSGLLGDAQKVTVRKNTGADVGTRQRLNFIEGANITLTIADDAGDNEVNVTIAASAGAGTWVGLTDTPGSFAANAVYRANAGATALELSGITVAGTTTSLPGTLDMEENDILAERRNIISPTAIAAQADDYDPTNFGTAYLVRVTLTGSQTITGFVAPVAGENEERVVTNVDGADTLTIADQDVASVAANRVITPDGADLALLPNESAKIRYDFTSSRWRVIAIGQVSAATAQPGLSRELWVDENAGATGDGSATDPYDTINKAHTDISAGPVAQAWVVHLQPGGYTFTGPWLAQRKVIYKSRSNDIPQLGTPEDDAGETAITTAATLTTVAADDSVLEFHGVNVTGQITVAGAAGLGIIKAFCGAEIGDINRTQTSTGILNVYIKDSRLSDFTGGGSTANQGTVYGQNAEFVVLTAWDVHSVEMHGGVIDFTGAVDLNVDGTSVILRNTRFPNTGNPPSIDFTGSAGLLDFDGISRANYDEADGVLDNGTQQVRKLYEHWFYAWDWEVPDSSDWALNSAAEIGTDTNNAKYIVGRFDGGTSGDEGIGIRFPTPLGVTMVQWTFVHRRETSGSAAEVQAAAAVRSTGDDSAPSAWSAFTDIGDGINGFPVPADEDWQIDVIREPITDWSTWVAGEETEVEVIRDPDDPSDNLTGVDWTLRAVHVELT